MIVGITANMSFNLVDTYFIGKLGADQLTAISFSFPVVLTILNLSIGIAIGTNSVLSRMLGENKDDDVHALSSYIVILGSFLALAIAGLGILTIEPLFTLIGAQKVHLPYIEDYMIYAYIAMAFRMISISVSGTYRAHGITLIPSIAILITATFNLILDPLLIFGYGILPELGIKGAGIATMLANFLAMCFELGLAKYKYHFFGSLKGEVFKRKWSELLNIVLPASTANALNPIALNVINYFVSLQSADKVAGVGVATKIQFFSMIPILALSAAIGPVVGQNFGAQKNERVSETLKYIFMFSLSWGLLQFVVLFLGADFFASFFTDDQNIISHSTEYLNYIAPSLFGYNLVILICSGLNALNYPRSSFVLIFLRSLGLFILLYYIFRVLGLDEHVLSAIACANVLTGIFSIFFAKQKFKFS
tara:strand:- start:15634 stop:16896 length:1263 start_codon:yes stop_codon:yes gene_type:complete